MIFIYSFQDMTLNVNLHGELFFFFFVILYVEWLTDRKQRNYKKL